MTDYTKNTNFTAKDALATGNPLKVIAGSLFDAEFDEIATAIATKEDTANKGAAGGYAPLNGSTQLADSYLTSNVPLLNAATNAFTGNATIGGTLGVTGAVTLSSTLAVTGALTIGGNAPMTTANDGTGSGYDADLLDGQHGAYYLAASSYTAADVLSKLLTVDGAGSGLDADLLDGQSSAYYATAASLSSYLALAGGTMTGPFIGVQASTPCVAVTFNATTMTVDCSLSNVFTTTFTANVTAAPTLSNADDGQTINWFITQDATGSRTMTWPTSFKWPNGTAGVLSTGANKVDMLIATYRSSTGFWYCSLVKDFS